MTPDPIRCDGRAPATQTLRSREWNGPPIGRGARVDSVLDAAITSSRRRAAVASA
jgi:hypothetical protein